MPKSAARLEIAQENGTLCVSLRRGPGASCKFDIRVDGKNLPEEGDPLVFVSDALSDIPRSCPPCSSCPWLPVNKSVRLNVALLHSI